MPGPNDDVVANAPEHSSAQVLLLTTTPTPDPGLHTRLGSLQHASPGAPIADL
ncbi:hypothetical protein [Streptomyces phaeoluteigriseus]